MLTLQRGKGLLDKASSEPENEQHSAPQLNLNRS